VAVAALADAVPLETDMTALLERPILPAETPLAEVRAFTRSRIPDVPDSSSQAQWKSYADQVRRDMFDRVVFRGAAAAWRSAERRVEWLETIAGGPGYKIRKLRYEAVPGLWIPALLYLPDNLVGPVPVVLNLNGHDRIGKAADYKQIRCINLARRGMIALNPEWLGMGQLAGDELSHYRMNQLDLCGTSGLAPFYLAMERGLDLLLSLEHADPHRVAVTGLSGGGWQTIFFSSLDSRVTLANPVAGYSSFLTRVDEPRDLGDSEQTPSDMATVADYRHLTALRAPRPTLLTFNAKDNCCFVADGALPPLLEAAEPIFQLFGCRSHLRTHVNYLPGDHNYALDNRLQLYRMIGEHFFPGDNQFPYEEFPCDGQLKSQEQLHVELPEGNASFRSLAISLAANLPRDPRIPASQEALAQWQADGRKRLAELVRATQDQVQATSVGEQQTADTRAIYWQLKVGEDWTVPATELVRGDPKSTILVLADAGRRSAAEQVAQLMDVDCRIVAIDPYGFGEAATADKQTLYALLVACVGQRPLGIQASQVAAIARWLGERDPGPVSVHAVGPRTSLAVLVAAALEPTAIMDVSLQGSLASLKQILDQDLDVPSGPELFCFGLLEQFDIQQLIGLVAPRPVRLGQASEGAGFGR
jgi:dienelactone hydrolase